MTIHEQLSIVFKIVDIENFSARVVCEYAGAPDSYLAHICTILDITEIGGCEVVIAAIENAENGLPFRDYHGLESLIDNQRYHIVPPNIVGYNNEWTIPMRDWKQLMQEWKDFRIANPPTTPITKQPAYNLRRFKIKK